MKNYSIKPVLLAAVLILASCFCFAQSGFMFNDLIAGKEVCIENWGFDTDNPLAHITIGEELDAVRGLNR